MKLLNGFWGRMLLPLRFAVEDGGGGGAPGDGGMSKEGGATTPVRYSQAEVDALVAGKLEGFAGVDVEEYRALKSEKVKRERETLEKRGDFEKILAQTVREKDEVIGGKEKDIAALGEQLRTIRVDNALLAAASAAKAINPAQIVTLLKECVHYDRKTDSVEVRENGAPLYRGGKPVTVELFVQEFLQANPHFLPAGPLGSGAGGGTAVAVGGGSAFRLSVEDAKDPAKYRALREAALKAGRSVEIIR